MSDVAKYVPEAPGPANLVILADVSGSMKGDKIRRLRTSLQVIWSERPEVRILAFASSVLWCDGPQELPQAGGGTDLAGALEAAATAWPAEVLVISDGLPDHKDRALEAAKRVPGVISVLFVGGDDDRDGAEFLSLLAARGGGTFVRRNLALHASIATDVRTMLALPAPIAL